MNNDNIIECTHNTLQLYIMLFKVSIYTFDNELNKYTVYRHTAVNTR